jgi:predicted phosphate transport protein (TIGR00153 family)
VRWFLPRNEDFVSLFALASANIIKGVEQFRELAGDLPNLRANVEKLKEIEHEGDRITHQTLGRLNATFITPFDREDIYSLATRLDDILDAVDGAAQRLLIYRVTEVPGRAVVLGDLLAASVREVQKAVAAIHDRKQHAAALAACVEINRLENEADVVHREALGELFEQCRDAIVILKLKEIYQFLEAATDRCEDVANVIESIVIKSS